MFPEVDHQPHQLTPSCNITLTAFICAIFMLSKSADSLRVYGRETNSGRLKDNSHTHTLSHSRPQVRVPNSRIRLLWCLPPQIHKQDGKHTVPHSFAVRAHRFIRIFARTPRLSYQTAADVRRQSFWPRTPRMMLCCGNVYALTSTSHRKGKPPRKYTRTTNTNTSGDLRMLGAQHKYVYVGLCVQITYITPYPVTPHIEWQEIEPLLVAAAAATFTAK